MEIPLTPEQIARRNIDSKLTEAGWIIQNVKEINWSDGIGIAVREYPTNSGPADYILFVNSKPVGVIEAKKEENGQNLSKVEDQTERYATSGLKWVPLESNDLPFCFESTGAITKFTDRRDPNPCSREIFSFFKPETLEEWIKQEKPIRVRFNDIPILDYKKLRECQEKAIKELEKSFREAKPRALIQMATGSGKTFTAITSVYRLLKFAKATRVLFLVDTRNLGIQAESEFLAYTPEDDKRKFNELYGVQRLRSRYIDPDNQVCISTIQRLYSILKGEELDEKAEEVNPNEFVQPKEPMPVVYNKNHPPEFFDFIIIDECHRSIYNLWRQVIEYFDAFLIGLTATPDSRTFGFFHENIVSEYKYEEAVADNVLVPHYVYKIETKITNQGAQISAKEYVEKRERETRKKRWERLDEDVQYAGSRLDKDIVNPSQIRNIIRTFKNKWPEIFPGREEVPKTLIFAKNDSHAEDIVAIVKEEFGKGNEFCKKITYNIQEDPSQILKGLRMEYNPRIAVTVDMIATGTDVKSLEIILFMRDVRSRTYYEQMFGRGTRTLGYDDLLQASPSAKSGKTHFVIIDAVGVTETQKIDPRPFERKKGVTMKDLLRGVLMGVTDEDTFLSLGNRLLTLEKLMTDKEKEKFKELSNGNKTVNETIKALLTAHDPDKIENRAGKIFPGINEYNQENLIKANKELLNETRFIFNGELNDYIENVRRIREQTIDNINIDEVTFTGWEEHSEERIKNIVTEFEEFIKQNKDRVTALKIFYDQPYQRKEITYQIISELREAILETKPNMAINEVWEAYKKLDNRNISNPITELTTLVALVRRVIGLDKELTLFSGTVNKNFQDWVFKKHAGAGTKFTDEQMEWLRMMKDYIAVSMNIDKETDFNNSPFAEKGGLMKAWKLFGDGLDELIEEMNKELIA